MSCKIEIFNYKPLYRPEEIIEGELVCIFHRRIAVQAITIELVGQEKTSWHKTVPRALGIPVVCTGSNTFLSIPTTLTEEDTFNEGYLRLPFAFELPRDIPCTYSSDFGTIRYYLQAKLKKSTSVADDMKVITVASPIDIEDVNIVYLTPFNGVVDKEISPSLFLQCFPHKPGRIFMKVFMLQRTIIQGETMSIIVHVVNRSELDVRSIELAIGQIIEYKVNNPEDDRKTQHETVFHESRKRGLRYRVGEYNFKVKIPTETVIPNFSRCTFISQKFYLQVITILNHNELKLYGRIMIAQNPNGTGLPNASELTAIANLRQELEEAGLSFTPSLIVLRALLTGNESVSTNQQPAPTITHNAVTTPQRRSSLRPSTTIINPEAPSVDLDVPPPSYESICGEGASKTTRVENYAPSAPHPALSYSSPSAPNTSPYPPTPMLMPTYSTNPVSSSVVASSVYPPEEAAPCLSEDAASKWDKLLSSMSIIIPSASKTATPSHPLPSGALTASAGNASSIYANLIRPPIGFCPLPASDGLYPPPIDSMRPPVALLPTLSVQRSAVSNASDNSASEAIADGLYPPPIESVRPSVVSMSTPLSGRLLEDSGPNEADGLYPPLIESIRYPVVSMPVPSLERLTVSITPENSAAAHLCPPPASDISKSFEDLDPPPVESVALTEDQIALTQKPFFVTTASKQVDDGLSLPSIDSVVPSASVDSSELSSPEDSASQTTLSAAASNNIASIQADDGLGSSITSSLALSSCITFPEAVNAAPAQNVPEVLTSYVCSTIGNEENAAVSKELRKAPARRKKKLVPA